MKKNNLEKPIIGGKIFTKNKRQREKQLACDYSSNNCEKRHFFNSKEILFLIQKRSPKVKKLNLQKFCTCRRDPTD